MRGAPKGHPPYPGCEKGKGPWNKEGGKFGYLGCPDNYFTDEELDELGLGVIEWIKKKNNIWIKFYFLDQGIKWNTVEKLRNRDKTFADRLEIAKSIQEYKLITEPYLKKADGNHARFILARHHKAEWEDKIETATEDQVKDLSTALELIQYLQSKSERKIADNNNINE